MRKKPNSGIWQYIDASGVLEHGTEAEIKEVKRQYRKKYLLEQKRRQRASRPEFAVAFSKEKGELELIANAAKKHSMKIPGFIKASALAYIQQKFVVPDKQAISEIEQLLLECLNTIQALSAKKERLPWEWGKKYEGIENCVIGLEKKIDTAFRHPLLLEESIKRSDLATKQRILAMLLHPYDSQNHST